NAYYCRASLRVQRWRDGLHLRLEGSASIRRHFHLNWLLDSHLSEIPFLHVDHYLQGRWNQRDERSLWADERARRNQPFGDHAVNRRHHGGVSHRELGGVELTLRLIDSGLRHREVLLGVWILRFLELRPGLHDCLL